MKVLILGGTGVISTVISRLLLERGDELILFNRGRTAARFPEGSRQITGDRDDTADFQAKVQAAGPYDCVIDMICYTPQQAETAVATFGGLTEQFIFCSTVDVYHRTPARLPIVEDELRLPSSTYGENKVKCEDIFLAADRRLEFHTTIIRPAQTYGEGGRLVHSFGFDTTYLDRIRKGKPIIVHGDGSSLWVSCHVDDVGPAFVAAINNPVAYGRAYHVTGEKWMTWNQYHQSVAEALGAPEPRLVHIPTDLLAALAPERAGICKGNLQYHNLFDNAAARRDLGFRQTIGWVDGVRRTVAWLDANGRINDSDADPLEDKIIEDWGWMSAALVSSTKGS